MSEFVTYLLPDGKTKLKKDLDSADSPIDLITNLSKVKIVPHSDLGPLYNAGEIAGTSVPTMFNNFILDCVSELKQKIPKMDQEERKRLLMDLEPYSEIEEFQDLYSKVLSSCNRVPTSANVPLRAQEDMNPNELSKMFLDDIGKLYNWLDLMFEEAKYNYSNDDFDYKFLFDKLAPVIFLKTKLVQHTNEYLTTEYFKQFHPSYAMIRLYNALYPSPISALDEARSLANILYNSFHGININSKNLTKACSICSTKLNIMLLSIPAMSIKSKIAYYGDKFGIPHDEFKELLKEMITPKPTTVRKFSENQTLLRIACITLIQGEKNMHPTIISAIAHGIPQEDLGMIMARNYDPKYQEILVSWSERDAIIYIDFMTRIKASHLHTPEFSRKPEMNLKQRSIVKIFKNL
jgi:hypothetical protein